MNIPWYVHWLVLLRMIPHCKFISIIRAAKHTSLVHKLTSFRRFDSHAQWADTGIVPEVLTIIFTQFNSSKTSGRLLIFLASSKYTAQLRFPAAGNAGCLLEITARYTNKKQQLSLLFLCISYAVTLCCANWNHLYSQLIKFEKEKAAI